MNAVPVEGDASALLVFERALRRLHALQRVELVFSDQPGYPSVPVAQTRELIRLETWIRWESNGNYWRRSNAENIAIARK